MRAIITSFSPGALAATSRASAASALSFIFFSPPSRYSALFLSKKYTNRNEAERLFPSENEWSLIMRYSKCAALLSSVL